jgi:hypothetical protein
VGAIGDWEDADGESEEDGDVEEDAGVECVDTDTKRY